MSAYSERLRIRASDIAAALGGKRGGNGNYMCRCPGPLHKNGDRNPSLSVKDGRDGRLLLYCFAGCEYLEIRDALERHMGVRA
jgi:hypothetical protein